MYIYIIQACDVADEEHFRSHGAQTRLNTAQKVNYKESGANTAGSIKNIHSDVNGVGFNTPYTTYNKKGRLSTIYTRTVVLYRLYDRTVLLI